jgi:hypothetical protein
MASGEPGLEVAQVIADGCLHQGADFLGAQGIATGFFFDDPFDHAGGKRHACGLDHLQVGWGQQVRFCRVALFAAVGQQRLDRAQRRAADFAHGL